MELRANPPSGAEEDGNLYRMRAIVHHRGPHPNHGHYLTDICNQVTGQWTRYNDSSVTEVCWKLIVSR